MSDTYGGQRPSKWPSSPTGLGSVHLGSVTKRNPSPSMPLSPNAPRMLQRLRPLRYSPPSPMACMVSTMLWPMNASSATLAS
jgi:hypothetical protein